MGKLYIVGIGPGNYENMTVRADNALKAADTIIGYHVYVELVRGRFPDKEYLTTPMTRETERCRMALDEAKKGKHVALVCSGDSGVYGMAVGIRGTPATSHQTYTVVVARSEEELNAMSLSFVRRFTGWNPFYIAIALVAAGLAASVAAFILLFFLRVEKTIGREQTEIKARHESKERN